MEKRQNVSLIFACLQHPNDTCQAQQDMQLSVHAPAAFTRICPTGVNFHNDYKEPIFIPAQDMYNHDNLLRANIKDNVLQVLPHVFCLSKNSISRTNQSSTCQIIHILSLTQPTHDRNLLEHVTPHAEYETAKTSHCMT